MQISSANHAKPALPIQAKASPTDLLQPAPAPEDETSFRRIAALLSMLENKPEIRPEVLARGRALASDRGYPQPEIINELAGLIVGDPR